MPRPILIARGEEKKSWNTGVADYGSVYYVKATVKKGRISTQNKGGREVKTRV